MTPQREKFAQEIVKGLSQSDAYRAAFKPKRASTKTVYEKASRLMKQPTVKARIKEIMAPVIEEIQVTKEQWLKYMERLYFADVRKMFDEHGHPIAIHLLCDNEAAMIEGFEVVEHFTKVKHNDGSTEAVCTGYTKKYKLTPKLKVMLEFGKVMGFYTEKHGIEGEFTLEQLVGLIVPKVERRGTKLVRGMNELDA